MGIVKDQSIRVTIATYIGVLIGAFNLLWLFPYCLSEEIIGLLKTIEAVAKIFFPFASLGVVAVCIRFFPRFRDNITGHHGFFGLLLLLPVLGIVGFLLFFFFFQDQISAWYIEKSTLFVDYLYLVVPLCIFFVYKSALEAYTSALKQTVVPSIIREIIMRVLFTVITILYFFKWIGLSELVTLYVGVFGIVGGLLLLYIQWLKQLYLKIDFKYWNQKIFKELGNYAMYSLLTGTAWILVANIDSIMIAQFKGLHDTGVYSIALFLGMFIEIPKRAIAQISGAIVADDLQAERYDKINDLYKVVSINQFTVGALLLVGIWVNIDNIFDLIPDEDYRAGKYVVLFIGLSRVIDMLTSINSEIITYSKYYRYNVVLISSLVGLTFITNYILIPPLGITGAAIATALSVFIFNLGKGALVWWKMNMHPFSGGTWKVMIIAAISLLVNQLVPYLGHFLLDIPIRSMIVGGTFLLLIWLWKVSPEINQLIVNIWTQIKKRIQ